MKIFGIILLVFGVLNFLIFLIGISSGMPEAASKLAPAVMLSAIGAYLIHRANQKQKK